MPYRLGSHYGIHVYQGDRPVATFFDAEEAAAFVAAMNERAGVEPDAWQRLCQQYAEELDAQRQALVDGPAQG